MFVEHRRLVGIQYMGFSLYLLVKFIVVCLHVYLCKLYTGV